MAEIPGSEIEVNLPDVSTAQRRRLLEDLLRGVSRTFYLTIRVLPASLRQPVGLAYLLARAADTIADTRLVSPGQRLTHLLSLRDQVKGPAALEPLQRIQQGLTDQQSLPEERTLLASLPALCSLLEKSPEPDRSLVRWVVETLTLGMEADLTAFPPEDSGLLASLEHAADLDFYAYQVAGCVGEFWTKITMAHQPALKGWDGEHMSKTGVAFGKALQLTNVLRDVPKDLRIGRCYFPRADLAGIGLSPEDLLDPAKGPAARPVLVAWIGTALEHYASAEEYLIAIPRRCLRLRLAVLWPILIGLATLARLATNGSWLDPAHPSRVSRGWVYRTLALSGPCAYSNRLMRAWIGRLRRDVESAI
ncbi:MAG: squalene/phytoene synthase family protein [Chloroflexi bacterium]|nr:squalene/phytoene synthase family protein [Chloroflexota bacterium]